MFSVMSLKERLNLADDPVFLLDGSVFLYRGFFANKNLRRSDGFPTGALVFLTRLLLRVLREENPRWLLFVLDGKGKNFRHETYPLYKANREATPENLVAQIEPAKRMIRALGLSLEVSEGCEADDCIASLAARFSQERPVVIVSGDKDLKQCLAPSVVMWDPAGKEEKLVTERAFMDENGISPAQWPDMQALIGDASDNIPGVPGIGPAAAKKIFAECRSLEDIGENLSLLPPKFQSKLKEHLDNAFVWRKLTTLSRAACREMRLEDIVVRPFNIPELRAFTEEFELAALRRHVETLPDPQKISAEAAGPEKDVPVAVRKIRRRTDLRYRPSLFDEQPSPSPEAASVPLLRTGTMSGAGPPETENPEKLPVADVCRLDDLPDCAGDVVALLEDGLAGEGRPSRLLLGLRKTKKEETDGGGDRAAQCAEEAEYVEYTWTGGVRLLLPWLAGARRIVCPDVKALLRASGRGVPGGMDRHDPFAEAGVLFRKSVDLGLAAWLTEPDESDYSWPRLVNRLGGGRTDGPALALDMAGTLCQQLAQNGLETLYTDLELPLTPVLAAMEERGVAIDLTAFKDFLLDVRKEIDSLSSRIYSVAGTCFNLRSARQLSEILFDRLSLPAPRKTRGGQASTAQETLERLSGRHEIIDLILRYRNLKKCAPPIWSRCRVSWTPTGVCTPPSTRKAPPRAGFLPSIPICRTSTCAANSANACAPVLSPRPAALSFPPIIRRLNYACWPTCRRTPPCWTPFVTMRTYTPAQRRSFTIPRRKKSAQRSGVAPKPSISD